MAALNAFIRMGCRIVEEQEVTRKNLEGKIG
jgi:hypothetical protein